MKKALIVLPTYNERENIHALIPAIFDVTKKIQNWNVSVLVVDDHSPDGTADEVRNLQKQYKSVHLIEGKKEGLGKAYTRGFEYGLEKIKPYVFLEMDSDLQHDPNYLPGFLKKIEEGADFVIGSRYMKGGSIPANWGIDRKIQSISANIIFRVGFMKPKITEWTNGYRAIKSWIVEKSINHIKNYSGYVFQIAFLDYALKLDAKIAELPVHFKDRKSGESKINAIQYTTNAFIYMFSHSSFIRFALVGALGFILDFSISFFLIEKIRMAIWLSTVISAEAAIISNFFLNNAWSFSHKRLEAGFINYLRKFIGFNFISGGSIIIQSTLMHFAAEGFGENYWYIYKVLIIILIIIPYSYLTYNKIIWKKKS